MKPYTYYLRNTKTNQKYYGLRYGNTVSADEDFGIHYFSSGDLKHEFRQNPEIFEWRIREHETTELARAYEDKILRKVVNKPGWVNHHVSGIIMTDEIAQKIKNTLTGTKRPRHVVDKILRTKAIMGTNGQPWTEDSRKKLSETVSSTSWYHDDVKSYRLKSDDPLCKKLKPGRLKNGWQNKINADRKPMSEAQRKRNGERFKGLKWFNDGVKNYRLDPNTSRAKGLIAGRINTTNRKSL